MDVSIVRVGWFVAVISGAVGSSALAEPAIRLEGVPDAAVFPMVDGENRIVNVTITGGAAQAVWIAAKRPDDPTIRCDGVALVPAGDNMWQINLAVTSLLEWVRASPTRREFMVIARLESGAVVSSVPVRYSLKAVPTRLEVPDGRASLTIIKVSEEIPGSGGQLSVDLGRLIGDRILVGVSGSQGGQVVDPRPMAEGESLVIPLELESYTLKLDKLNDPPDVEARATFSISTARVSDEQRIEQLLARIERCGLTFIRNGREVSAKVAAEFLKAQHAQMGQDVKTVDEFIAKMATRSSTSGQPYLVRLADGSTMELADWLVMPR